jgi:hypothetical protein
LISFGERLSSQPPVYCSPAGGYINADELRARLAGVALRRLREGRLELPPKQVIPLSVVLKGRRAELYERDTREGPVMAENTDDEFIEFTLAQKHRLAGYVQQDTPNVRGAELALRRPDPGRYWIL